MLLVLGRPDLSSRICLSLPSCCFCCCCCCCCCSSASSCRILLGFSCPVPALLESYFLSKACTTLLYLPNQLSHVSRFLPFQSLACHSLSFLPTLVGTLLSIAGLGFCLHTNNYMYLTVTIPLIHACMIYLVLWFFGSLVALALALAWSILSVFLSSLNCLWLVAYIVFSPCCPFSP